MRHLLSLAAAAIAFCATTPAAQADIFTLDCGNKIYVTIDNGANPSMVLDEPGIVSGERLEVLHMNDNEYAAGTPPPGFGVYTVNRKTGELVIHELKTDQYYRHLCTKTAAVPKPQNKF